MKLYNLFALLSLILGLLDAEEPWGPDADMAYPRVVNVCPVQENNSPAYAISDLLIRFHQVVISPCDGPRSHYRPTSSQYMLDAIRRYGLIQGFPMGCDRLMRENGEPWVYRMTIDEDGIPIKWDPIKDIRDL